MGKLMKIKANEIPLLLAAVVFVVSMLSWIHSQSRRTTALAATNMTLTTLQHALDQYMDATGRPPPTVMGHSSLYGFLVSYQQRFSHQTPCGQWSANPHSAMSFLRPDLAVRGWVPMPHGRMMRGIVSVRDGFGQRIRYIRNHQGLADGPCFVSPGGGLVIAGHGCIASRTGEGF